ncbi:3',5'-cyclic-nucleotide phosphodiesterase (macronuclear) [Tetrahymena thermophila SB210]|uniref:Phosphodiesterase n=1 Tax=Tetrahymena thermophila (strain SB210) TaxID=312017 RepID=I7MEB2_TETTS|nr:3',5'-cyclic-nucleotide phosphodiesterase [Tetrahymena thermophila SB210]EAR95996.2 3',5'-cyclic-nucleotide phosphodiesterase [Tetrahymena thermophila SB210]|eukprot:XP_001016241.2 3',5'-cyclic-nucleotide phosphodiesterase [Tetrahymena thermophila SB210]
MAQHQHNSFLKQLENEIVFIRSFLYSRLPQNKKEEFNNFEKIYETIALQIKSGAIKEELAPSIYSQFVKTLKSFKRRQENQLKYPERDIDAFRKKYESTGQTLLPLIHDIKLNMNDRMNKFDISKVLDFNFNMHLYTNKELVDIAFQMFEYANIHTKYNIDDSFLKDLLEEMCMNYNVIPYHNWTHAFQLSQMFFTVYFTSDFKDLIDSFEFFVGLLSGLAHDMNHKGVNNLYKVKRKAENSLRYMEQAVLENMHVSTFFHIISRNPQFDIASKFQDAAKLNKFKKLLVSNILATDMGRHGQFITDLKTKTKAYLNVKQNPENADPLDKYLAFNKDSEQDREFLTNIMIHACDIGNPCYSFDNYMNWCYLLSQEFHDQTIKEEQKGVPVTTFLQYTGKQAFRKGQIFFSSSLLMPLWKELGNLIPQLQVLPEQLAKNIKQIEDDLSKN